MKTIFRIALAAAVVATMAGCKAFRTLTDSRLKTAQGAPYELIVVCPVSYTHLTLPTTSRV